MGWGGIDGAGGGYHDARWAPGPYPALPPSAPAGPPPRRFAWLLWLLVPAVVLIATGTYAIGTRVNDAVSGNDDAVTSPPASRLHQFSEPRWVAGSLVAIGDDHVTGFDGQGLPVWKSPYCTGAEWASPLSNPTAAFVVVVCRGVYTAFDPTDGHLVSQIERPDEVDQTRIGGTTLVVNTPAIIEVIDLTTGRSRWSRQGLAEPAVTADATTVYIGTAQGVMALDAATGDTRWFTAVPTSDVWSTGARVFVRTRVPRHVTQLDAATGAAGWASADDPAGLDTSFLLGATDQLALIGRQTHDRFDLYDTARATPRFTIDLPAGDVGFAVMSERAVLVMDDTARTATAYDIASGAVIEPPGALRSGRAALSGASIALPFAQPSDHLRLHTLP